MGSLPFSLIAFQSSIYDYTPLILIINQEYTSDQNMPKPLVNITIIPNNTIDK